jgi:hypothetical protein
VSNDVIIRVRVKQDARDGFAAVGKEAEAEGQRSAEKFTSRFGTIMGRMAQLIQEPIRRASSTIGEHMGDQTGRSFVTRLGTSISSQASRLVEMGRNIGRTTGNSITTEISDSVVRGYRDANGRLRDEGGRLTSGSRSTGTSNSRGGRGGEGGKGGDATLDKQSWLSKALGWGKDAAAGFATSFLSSIGTILSPGNILAAIGIVSFAGLLAAPVAAAFTSAVLLALGGGVIALGVVAAFKDPRIQAAGKETSDRLGKLFAKFGEPFRGPVANFLEKLNQFITSMLPNFEHLGTVLGPVADKLGSGIIGMLQNMMPGLIDGIEGAAPIIEVLAKRLPDIGQALGDFFREMGEHGPQAAVFFNDLISFLIKVISWIGRVIGFFTSLYVGVRNFVTDAKALILGFAGIVIDWFEKILNTASIAFGWIPGLGSKLKTAQSAFRDARKDINAEMAKIKDKKVVIRMSVIGLAAGRAAANVFSQMAALGYASGGIVGQLPPIAQAASGGIRSGLTLVGERGPELANLAPGSRVHSNEDSRRMAAAGGDDGAGWMEARWIGSESALVREIMNSIQLRVARSFGGSVQGAMGR